MKGKFFAVGVGPGDPELLTIKAVKLIEESDIIAVPDSGATDNIAVRITGKYLEGKEVVNCPMPMTKDKAVLDKYHRESAATLAKYLDEGKQVAFLTLGDPTIYSTVMYVHRKLTEMGYETGIVSGIPSFCAVAAALNTSLCEREEMLHIIPATFRADMVDELEGTKVLMKSGKTIMSVKEQLSDRKAMMVECATMENQKIYKDLKDLQEQSSYFSVIVIPADRQE